jgi:general secretion pathway protein D
MPEVLTMIKEFRNIQRAIVLILVFMLAAPVVSFADHKKYFKEGMKYEINRQWDKAAEEFAKAASEKPANVEYQLHLSRALVNAALMLIERGDRLADEKDYQAAYQAFRQAFAFDRTNELALIKARRMLEVLGLPTDSLPSLNDPAGPQTKPRRDTDPNQKARYTTSFNGSIQPSTAIGTVPAHLTAAPSRKFQKTRVIYRDNFLLTIIEQLAQTMGLNVIFDSQVANQLKVTKISFEMNDVTYPRALEMILKTNNLMYIQLDTRTIVVATDGQQSRMKYEQFAIRTFYIKNGDVEQIRGAIQAATQAKTLTSIKQLNAIVVRDTPTNIQLIESLIETLDKSKAEVLIDIQIFEVSKNDLLQIGNQFGSQDKEGSVVGTIFGGFGQNGTAPNTPNTHLFANTNVLGFALGLPPSSISFFQNKGKAKLLASTQVHILDTEKQNIRIGRRVPIQTASLPSYVNPTQGNNQNNQNNSQFLGGQFGVGIPQIQYENVGLNIDMEPKVFEDEVQMVMKIESTSLDLSSGRLTPTFNQRTMQSVARVKDGQQTLIAGVSQTEESKSTRGFPILGLIPILGRFFATPETNNTQSDVVITVTPHILRRADIQDRDHFAYQSGTQTDPSTQLSLEQILSIADAVDSQKEQVAGAGAPPPAPAATPQSTPASSTQTQTTAPQGAVVNVNLPGVVVSPINQTTTQPATTNQVKPNVERKSVPQPGAPTRQEIDDDDDDEDDEEETPNAASAVSLMVRGAASVATKNQDFYVGIFVNGAGSIASTNFSLSYDPNILEIKGVRDGGLLRAGGVNPELQFTAEGGLLNVQMSRPPGSAAVRPSGQLLIIVFTPKGQGSSPLSINEQQTFVRSVQGQVVPLRFQSSQVEVR